MAAVVRHDFRRRIDREGDDFLRRVVRDRFDVHAALGRHDEGNARRGAVDQDRQIKLLVDRRAVLDVKAVDLLAGLAGLDGDERVPEHLLGESLGFLDRFGEAHAALFAGGGLLERALAASACMDLRLHDIDRAGQGLRRRGRVLGLQNRDAGGDGGAEFTQNGLGLIFMDIHVVP